MDRYFLPILFLFIVGTGFSQSGVKNHYWLQFSDKKGTNYSTDRPQEFLSPRALERRMKQQIDIDERDLPVSQVYLDSLGARGAKIVHTSKWLNGATILATDSVYQQLLGAFSFIQFSQLTKPGLAQKSFKNKFALEQKLTEIDPTNYGNSFGQIALFNGYFLHQQNDFGQGMQIAVLDAGFYNVDSYPAFKKMRDENRILGTRDFVEPGGNVYEKHDHGTSVLSTMGGEIDGELIGTAPEASYYLLRSEDVDSEYLIEEDNWVAAAEYADSLGCDIINSSLGYSQFDDANMNHTYADMNGHTTRVTKAANIAVEKGMLVFSSAGNEANDSWQYIIAPSDGDQVIAVGAVNRDSIRASFSSVGPASDGDVKPNLDAVGWGTMVQTKYGSVAPANGTSFSSPVLAGMTACLWQANPQASNMEIKSALEMSASQYDSPDSLLGYGIPDFKKANLMLSEIKQPATSKDWTAVPNPFRERIYFIKTDHKPVKHVILSLFSIHGNLVLKQEFQQTSFISLSNLANLPSGIILAKIETETKASVVKLMKVNP